MEPRRSDPVLDFFSRQTVFLTGSTGGLGGCLLYKLVVTLGVAKVFALVRGDAATAKRKWAASMGSKSEDILRTGKIVFVPGDTTKPSLGMSPEHRAEIQDSVTLVIHAAADINFRDPLPVLVANNTSSTLELASMARDFKKLHLFVHVSTAYVNSFLEDGEVAEEVYRVGDPEKEIADITAGRGSGRVEAYPWPYGYSKHLTEQLVTLRFPQLPLLIVRPSCIGPAAQVPFPQYMPVTSSPLSNFYARLLFPTGGTNIFPPCRGSASGTNVLDEIPVDLAANILLQHTYLRTVGVVHASSSLYVAKTLDDYLADARRYAPASWRPRMAQAIFSTDNHLATGKLANFYAVLSRDWRFRTSRSRDLEQDGILGLSLKGHDPEKYVEDRLRLIVKQVKQRFKADDRSMNEEARL
ncbi:hypothetical protein DL769_008046 [Monosporascus sp. CRB-8-3]|nr:hypothetical protein DL769_008046 [Monosporascus sp. CRB-8-3]